MPFVDVSTYPLSVIEFTTDELKIMLDIVAAAESKHLAYSLPRSRPDDTHHSASQETSPCFIRYSE